MSDNNDPTSRIALQGEFEPFIANVTEAYGIGTPQSHSIIGVGYEDCNVAINTDQGRYVAKMFAKSRKPDEITRYVDIMQHVVDAGVNHPELLKTQDDSVVFADSGVSTVLMEFIDGKSFLELNRAPTDEERVAVLEQAAKVNSIDYKPPYLFDSWAIPNIRAMYNRVKQYVKPEDLDLAERAIAGYEAIPVDALPHCFVHGDFTKANILKAANGPIFVVDFSVANQYPRIQELAVIAANLLHSYDELSLADRCRVVADEYSKFNELTDEERKYLPAYALAGVAMEFLGSHQEKFINGIDNEETEYWLNLGREGLRKELA